MPYVKRKKRKKTKSRFNSRTLKLYIAIILVCFVVGWALATVVVKAPEVTSKIESSIIEKAVEQEIGGKLDEDTVEQFKKSFKGGNLEGMDIEKLKKRYKNLKPKKK